MSDATLTSGTTSAINGSTFRFSATETLKHVVLIFGSLIVLLPFYVMVSYSL